MINVNKINQKKMIFTCHHDCELQPAGKRGAFTCM